MSTRMVLLLHYSWMAFIALLVLWGSWLFRFHDDRGYAYLDRWAGEIVDVGTSTQRRFSLRQPRYVKADVTELTLENTPPRRSGFIPLPGNGSEAPER